MTVVISRKTHDALVRVMQFFGIDEYNRPIFSDAAERAGIDAFSKVVEAIDGAAASDPRRGVTQRIRQRIEREKALAEDVKSRNGTRK